MFLKIVYKISLFICWSLLSLLNVLEQNFMLKRDRWSLFSVILINKIINIDKTRPFYNRLFEVKTVFTVSITATITSFFMKCTGLAVFVSWQCVLIPLTVLLVLLIVSVIRCIAKM